MCLKKNTSCKLILSYSVDKSEKQPELHAAHDCIHNVHEEKAGWFMKRSYIFPRNYFWTVIAIVFS